MTEGTEITLKIRVLTKQGKPEWRAYTITVDGEMSVLNALEYVHEHVDPSLYFRSSCRRGVCGACTMRINGRQRLACQTLVEDGMEVDPLGDVNE